MWSKWKDLAPSANYDGPAIYGIRLCNSGITIPIRRFLGSDDSGLLCIGKTSNLERRRKALLRGMGKVGGHSEGNLLHILEQKTSLSKNYPKRRYEYSFVRVRPGEETALEEKRIKAYVKQFGELPPLNSAIPSRYKDW